MNQKITEMDLVDSLDGTEDVPIVKAGENKRIKTSALTSGTISSLTTGRLPKAASASTLNDSEVFQSGTSIGIGTTLPDRKLHIESDSATTDAVSYVQRITSTSSGTPANGIGVGIEFEVETSSGNNEVGATIEAVASDVGSASEDFDLVFRLMNNGASAIEAARLQTVTTGVYYTIGSGLSGGDNRIVAGGSGSSANLSIRSKGSGTLSLLAGTNQIVIDGNGNDIQSFTNNILSFFSGSTNTVLPAATVRSRVVGTPATGTGVSIVFQTNTTGSTYITGSTIESVSTDITGSSEDFDLVFKTMAGGAAAAQAVRVKSDKSTVFNGPVVLQSYTVAGVPAAASYTGGMIYVSNETGGAIPAFSDGTNWRRVTDRAIIS